MSEKVISILLSAKDATASAFDRAKGGIKSLSDDTQKATSGIKAATNAVSKAMSGDLVGAAQSAASAFKALWSVVLSNPIAGLVAGAAAAAVGLYKLWQRHQEAKKAAQEHAREIEKLRGELDALAGVETVMDKVAAKAKDMADAMDEFGLRKQIQAIKDYKAELAGLADMKLAEMSVMTDEKQIKAAREEYDKLLEKMKTLSDAQKEYEGALKDVRTAQEEAAKAEQKAADQAAKNKAAQIEAERKLRMAIDETFARYENQWQKQQQQYLDDEAAFDKMVSRRKELEGATDALAKADLERKHILEDIEALMNAPEGAKTLEYKQLVEDLRLKEREIAQIKQAAAAAAAKEAADRLKGANDVLAVEEKIKKVKEPDAWDQKGWKANDPRKKVVDPWDELKKKKPEFPPPVPPLPQNPNAPGQPGGGAAADPWSIKLDAIRNEVKQLRGDLTGGGAA
ncbi:MAG TPA: hypothetical protein P5318_19470 [Candidatus Hydrogenedentes bacterium]|nr:hypothetical protein [Candidatus Hydrogenedentota bacterium]